LPQPKRLKPEVPQWVVIRQSEGMQGGIFCITRGNLRHANYHFKDGQLYSRDWGVPACALCPDGAGGVFAVTSGRLRHASYADLEGQVWSEDWSPDAMVEDGSGGVFIISRGNLRHVTESNKIGERANFWSKDWSPDCNMVSDGSGGVFIITRGNLRHATEANKDGDFWSKDWSPSAMVSDGSGGVFIITRGNLRHVTEANKDGDFWSQDWSPSAMVSNGRGGVFIITRGNLRHVTKANKDGELWSKDWHPDCNMVSDGRGGLFIISRGNLRHVTKAHKDGIVWSSDWSPSAICAAPYLPYLFHGTRADNSQDIYDNGLLASKGGRLGPGTYLTGDFELADKAADRHGVQGTGTGKLVVVVKMELGRMVDLGTDWDTKGKWQESGECSTCTGIHPPWLNFEEFREFNVRAGVSYTIVAMHSVGGHFTLPDGTKAEVTGAIRLSPAPSFHTK